MKRLYRNIRARDAALEQRPEVFKAIGVYAAIHILGSVVYDLMRVFASQSFVGHKRIGIERSASSDMLAYLILQNLLAAARYDRSANLAATLQDSHDCGFVLGASSCDAALALGDVHVSRFPSDEGFIDFDFAADFGPEKTVLHY